MNLNKLKTVTKFIISQKGNVQVASAMRTFNETRYEVAAKARETLIHSTKLITALRKAVSVTQIESVPENTQCCVSKEKLVDRIGMTLLIKMEDSKQAVFCIHSRFLDSCYQLFISSHFPLHIRQHFSRWCSAQPWWVPGDYSDNAIKRYLEYNNERNLKLLLIQLKQNT